MIKKGKTLTILELVQLDECFINILAHPDIAHPVHFNWNYVLFCSNGESNFQDIQIIDSEDEVNFIDFTMETFDEIDKLKNHIKETHNLFDVMRIFDLNNKCELFYNIISEVELTKQEKK